MHTAEQLDVNQFELILEGRPAALGDLFGEWTQVDRFGLVVSEPFGTLGASLLVQAAIALFYEDRRAEGAGSDEYPEVYLFHLGGRFGDHSVFDFWPPRKEVFLRTHDPLALLEALNDRAITLLALPDGPHGDAASLGTGTSTWAEQGSAMHRLRSAITYGIDGRVKGADVELRSDDPHLAENPIASLRPLETLAAYEESLKAEPLQKLPGPSVLGDVERWAAQFRRRANEVSKEERLRRLPDFDPPGSFSRAEQFRRLDRSELLLQLAGLGAS